VIKMLYSTKSTENAGKAYGVSIPLSLKQSVEVCNFIRGRDVNKAIRLLDAVTNFNFAIPYKRFNRGGVGHKAKIGPGRYPVTVCREITKLLNSARINARQKGLDGDSLVISSIIPKQGPNTPRYGRKRGRSAKRIHIEVVLTPSKEAVKDKPTPKNKQQQPTAENKKQTTPKPQQTTTDNNKQQQTTPTTANKNNQTNNKADKK